MKKKHILIALAISLVLYIIIINLISIFSPQLQANNTQDTTYSSGETQKLNVGDSIGVQITRIRWYGKIYEEGDSRILYILGKIRIPIEENGSDYMLFHIIFILFWSFILIRTLIVKERTQEVIEEEQEEIQEQNI